MYARVQWPATATDSSMRAKRLSAEALRRRRLFNQSQSCHLLLKHGPEGCNLACDRVLKFRANMLKKWLVLGLGLGQSNLDMGATIGVLHERVGHQNLGGVRQRQQCGERQIVERAPVEHF